MENKTKTESTKTNYDIMQMMFSISSQAGKNYMKQLGHVYKPWFRVDKLGRNDVCSCGSGLKVKKCCGVTYEYDIKN